MAIIGTLGDIVFTVTSKEVKTFSGMNYKTKARWSKHTRHLQDELLEFEGTESSEISFSMYFSVFLGVNPTAEIEKLLRAERAGQVMRLIVGRKIYGKYKWVIEETDKNLERFDNRGRLLVARVNITLKEYARR